MYKIIVQNNPIPVQAILMNRYIVSLSDEAFYGRPSQQKAYFPELPQVSTSTEVPLCTSKIEGIL